MAANEPTAPTDAPAIVALEVVERGGGVGVVDGAEACAGGGSRDDLSDDDGNVDGDGDGDGVGQPTIGVSPVAAKPSMGCAKAWAPNQNVSINLCGRKVITLPVTLATQGTRFVSPLTLNPVTVYVELTVKSL